MRRVVTVLSVDGGGMRGLIPAFVIAELDRRLKQAGDPRPFVSHFDLIAGTSTGALVALALAAPASGTSDAGRTWGDTPAFEPADIVRLYEERGAEIFPPTSHKKFKSATQLFTEKYDAAGLERVLRDLLGDRTLRDGLTNLFITAFDTQTMEPHCMKNRPLRAEWEDDLDFLMRDAARGSSAAPTFFPPARIEPIPADGRTFCLVDGAVFASNPAMLAYVEALKIFPRARDHAVISLGTGHSRRTYGYEEIRKWGIAEWLNPRKEVPLVAMAGAGQSESVGHQLRRFPNVRYVRLNTDLEEDALAIDVATPEQISNLKRAADRLINENDREIDEICRILTRRP